MSFDKRVWECEYARRKRARKLDAKRATAALCPFRQGRYGACGSVLEISVDRMGRMVTRCFKCERRLAGICQDCPRPVQGRPRSALRCGECKKREMLQAARRYRARHLDEVRAKDVLHQRRLRAANPEKGRQYARNYARAHRAQCTAYTRRWRRENPLKYRRMQKRWARKRRLKLRAMRMAA